MNLESEVFPILSLAEAILPTEPLFSDTTWSLSYVYMEDSAALFYEN
jgi:hypothetical protein